MAAGFCHSRPQTWFWPAAGVSVRADGPGLRAALAPRHVGPVLPREGLLFSLTQVTFQPFPLPSFSALSSTQPMLGVWVVVREGGCVPPPSQGSLNSLHPSSLRSVPLSTAIHAEAGADLVSLWWGLCHVFLRPGCSGWWVRLLTSPLHPPTGGCVCQEEGALIF